jgi:hypothetical protein
MERGIIRTCYTLWQNTKLPNLMYVVYYYRYWEIRDLNILHWIDWLLFTCSNNTTLHLVELVICMLRFRSAFVHPCFASGVRVSQGLVFFVSPSIYDFWLAVWHLKLSLSYLLTLYVIVYIWKDLNFHVF